jgi:hypothetical protein
VESRWTFCPVRQRVGGPIARWLPDRRHEHKRPAPGPGARHPKTECLMTDN